MRKAETMKVHIDYPAHFDVARIWIIDTDANGKRYILRPKGDLWERDEINYNIDQKPSLFLPAIISKPIMKAMCEAFTANGIKTDNDHKIEGTLEATKYHLEDLRNLLKLRKP